MCAMPATSYIQCRVTSEVKGRVRALAQRQQLSESGLLKHLLNMTLQAGCDPGGGVSGPICRSSRTARLYVRLPPDDRMLLAERASARGMPAATYVAVLVRSHLRNLSPLPTAELLELRRSVNELRAIGQNINQVAAAANRGQRVPDLTRENLRTFLGVCGALRDNVRGLMAANVKSWHQGHGEDR